MMNTLPDWLLYLGLIKHVSNVPLKATLPALSPVVNAIGNDSFLDEKCPNGFNTNQIRTRPKRLGPHLSYNDNLANIFLSALLRP